MQGRQGMGQQMSQGMGQGMSQGNTALGQALLKQIEDMKNGLGYSGMARGNKAESGWGLGTSPYAVNPAPADASNQVEDRQGDQSLGDTAPVDFDPLYAPEDNAHGFTSEDQLHGQFDPSAPPEKVEEVRSAPETQEALVDYADIIGSYAEGDESAISLEQVPVEYQELVRKYFENLNEQSNADGGGAETEGDGEGEGEGDAGEEGEGEG